MKRGGGRKSYSWRLPSLLYTHPRLRLRRRLLVYLSRRRRGSTLLDDGAFFSAAAAAVAAAPSALQAALSVCLCVRVCVSIYRHFYSTAKSIVEGRSRDFFECALFLEWQRGAAAATLVEQLRRVILYSLFGHCRVRAPNWLRLIDFSEKPAGSVYELLSTRTKAG